MTRPDGPVSIFEALAAGDPIVMWGLVILGVGFAIAAPIAAYAIYLARTTEPRKPPRTYRRRGETIILAVTDEAAHLEHPAHSGNKYAGGYARAVALSEGDPDWMNARGGQG